MKKSFSPLDIILRNDSSTISIFSGRIIDIIDFFGEDYRFFNLQRLEIVTTHIYNLVLERVYLCVVNYVECSRGRLENSSVAPYVLRAMQ